MGPLTRVLAGVIITLAMCLPARTGTVDNIVRTVPILVNPSSTTTRPSSTVTANTTAVTCASPSVFTMANTFVAGQEVTLAAAPCATSGFSTGVIYFISTTNLTAAHFELAASSAALGTPINGVGTATNVISVSTVYGPNSLIASSATAGSVTVPAISNVARIAGGGFRIPRAVLQTSGTTGWGGATMAINLWTAAPTYTYGDAAPYTVATGSASKIATFNCLLSQYGDGAEGECSPSAGSSAARDLASGTVLYGDIEYTGTTAITPTASQTFTITLDVYQN